MHSNTNTNTVKVQISLIRTSEYSCVVEMTEAEYDRIINLWQNPTTYNKANELINELVEPEDCVGETLEEIIAFDKTDDN